MMDESSNSLRSALMFSTLYANCSFRQVEIDNADCDKPAFRSRQGLFRFSRMLFGLPNAPGIFQRTMAVISSPKMAICPSVSWRHYQTFPQCNRTYFPCLHCTVVLPQCCRLTKVQGVQQEMEPKNGLSWEFYTARNIGAGQLYFWFNLKLKTSPEPN